MECACAHVEAYRVTGHAAWCPASPVAKGWMYEELTRVTQLIDMEAANSSPRERDVITQHFAAMDWGQPIDDVLVALMKLVISCSEQGRYMYAAHCRLDQWTECLRGKTLNR